METYDPEVLDKAGLLDRLGGDLELFQEITGLFQQDCPKLLSAVRAAVSGQNPTALERAAHTLKGCVANFNAGAVYQAALRLEQMGRAGETQAAAGAYTALESEIRRFQQALYVLARELAQS